MLLQLAAHLYSLRVLLLGSLNVPKPWLNYPLCLCSLGSHPSAACCPCLCSADSSPHGGPTADPVPNNLWKQHRVLLIPCYVHSFIFFPFCCFPLHSLYTIIFLLPGAQPSPNLFQLWPVSLGEFHLKIYIYIFEYIFISQHDCRFSSWSYITSNACKDSIGGHISTTVCDIVWFTRLLRSRPTLMLNPLWRRNSSKSRSQHQLPN